MSAAGPPQGTQHRSPQGGTPVPATREQLLADLKNFLRTIQKPNRPVDSVGVDEPLVASGLVDSLAIMQIVVYLEEKHGIDFAASGFDPDRLATMGGIVDLVMQARG